MRKMALSVLRRKISYPILRGWFSGEPEPIILTTGHDHRPVAVLMPYDEWVKMISHLAHTKFPILSAEQIAQAIKEGS